MSNSLLALAAEARLAQLDLNAARRAHSLGQVTDRELSMTEAERDSAIEFYEEGEAELDEATPLFAPRPWLADDAYLPDFAAHERDAVSRETAQELQLDPFATQLEQDWANAQLPPQGS